MKQKRRKTERKSRRSAKTPEHEENLEEHPNREDDPGAWNDQDSGWTLGERMPN